MGPPTGRQHTRGSYPESYVCVYSDAHLAVIFVTDDVFREISRGVLLSLSSVDLEDIHWAVNHNLLQLVDYHKHFTDHLVRTLGIISLGFQTFEDLPERIIRAKTLMHPVMEHSWVAPIEAMESQVGGFELPFSVGMRPRVSIISYFTGSCDIPEKDIPTNFMGISVGDSLYVPNKLLDDPMKLSKRLCLIRDLGNIGQPGFTLPSCVANPVVSPRDHSEQVFDGKPDNALKATSMHLSFTG
ncbi:hypothetical protein GGR51DRAFT_577410 [Nemania sp. FL0031]|nr:hypothetical protein GGR51DRAFT_577410 [Nemania sp. FL0031]